MLGELARAAPRHARARLRGRVRAGGAGDRRPAGLGRRGAHRARAAGRPLRRAARRADRCDHAPLPHRRDARRGRPRRAAVPAQARRRRCARWPCSWPARGCASTPAPTRRPRSRRCSTSPASAPWTASYVAMRALGDPDAFLPGDVGIRHALRRLGQSAEGPRATAIAEPWRPWRSYAVMHLWASVSAAPDGAPGGATSPTRLPSAMFASTRCRPQLASGDGWKTGAPRSGPITSTFAPPRRSSARGRRSATRPTASTRPAAGTPSERDRRRDRACPGANGSLGLDRRDLRRAAAERGGVGAEHLLAGVARCGRRWRSRAAARRRSRTRRRSRSGERERQARTCLKSPPTSLPFFTSTLPPSSSAEMSRWRTFGLGSISFATSWRSTNVPCEWPISTTPRPVL